MKKTWCRIVLFSLVAVMVARPGYADRNNCQCTEYTKCATGMLIDGNGAQWDDYSNAIARGYKVVSSPVVNGAMNFDASYFKDPIVHAAGHVAKVIAYSQTIDQKSWVVTVDHANWHTDGDLKLTSCGCSNVERHVFTVPKTATNVHYIAPPNYNKIVNKKSNKCMDVSGGSTDNWAKLIEYTCSNDSNMYWKLVGVSVGSDYTKNPYFQIKNKKSSKCVDTDHGNTADWTSIIQYSCSTDSNMQWQPEIGKPGRLKNKKDLAKCMDLDHGNTNNWNPLVLYKCNTDSNMYWNINPQ